jgi:hypothetical protein
VKQIPRLPKRRPKEGNNVDAAVVAPPKTEEGFHLEDKDQTESISTKRLQGGPQHPKTPPLLTPTP